MKLWLRAQAKIFSLQQKGLVGSCLSAHFVHHNYEVTIAIDVCNSRPKIMLYSNMVMVWIEIVLHKDVNWQNVAGYNVIFLNCSQIIIIQRLQFINLRHLLCLKI